MKTKAKLRRNISAFKNAPFLAPHRMIDDSPAGHPDSTRRVSLRVPLRALGQIGRDSKTRHPSQTADEIDGGTEIADRKTNTSTEHSNEQKSDPERHSVSDSPDPRKLPEKEAEKERKGLDREFANPVKPA